MFMSQSTEGILSLLGLVIAFVGLLIYLGFAARFMGGDGMDKPNRMPQFYGYSVCLITVVVFFFSLGSIVGALFDLADPLHTQNEFLPMPMRANLSSFESFKMDTLNPLYRPAESAKSGYIPDDGTLQRMYEAAKAEKVRTVRLRAMRSLVTDIIVIAASVVIYMLHWNWLKRIKSETA